MNLRSLRRRLTIGILLATVLVYVTMSVSLADGVRKRIKFPRGRTSTVINSAVLREDIDQYLVGAKAGQ